MRTLLLIILLLTNLYSFHDHEKKEQKEEHSLLENTLNSLEDKLKLVYDGLNLSSKYIDEFLTGEEDDRIYKESFIRFEQSIKLQSRGDNDFSPTLDIRIKLPKLEEKLSLQFTNDDETINRNYQDSNEEISYQDDNYSAGLLYNFFNTDFDASFKGGVKLTSSPYIFVEGKISKDIKLNTNSNLYIKEKLRYSNKKELENFTSLEYKHRFDSKIYISNFNQYYINSNDEINIFYNSLRLNKRINRYKYINYVTSITTNDENEFETIEYKVYASYREYIRDWLYYDLVPEVQWHDDNSFKENYIAKFNLGILIGE